VDKPAGIADAPGMAAAAPPRCLDRRTAAPPRQGSIAMVPLPPETPTGDRAPPFDEPPRPPETGGGGGGGGGFSDDDGRPSPRPALPVAVWVMVAAVALALPAGFLAAALVHGRV
jgi:hypothetical protein